MQQRKTTMTEQSVTKHPIHNAAVYGTFSDFEALVNKVGSQEELVKLFQAQDENGNTILHHIAGGRGTLSRSECLVESLWVWGSDPLYGSEYEGPVAYWIASEEWEKVAAIHDTFSKEQWLALIETQNNFGDTAFHKAAGSYELSEYTLILIFLLCSIESEIHEILAIQNGRGETAIHIAMRQHMTTALWSILCDIEPSSPQGFALIKSYSIGGFPLLFNQDIDFNNEYDPDRDIAAEVIHRSLTQQQWLELLEQANNEGETSFHWLVTQGSVDIRFFIFRSLTESNLIQLLTTESTKDEYFMKRVKDLMRYDSVYDYDLNYSDSTSSLYNIVRLVCKLITHEVCYHLVESLFTECFKPAGTFGYYTNQRNIALARTILDNVAPGYQLKLVGEKSGLESRLPLWWEGNEHLDLTEHISLLGSYRTRSKVSITIATNDIKEQNEKLRDIIENEPLTTDQIKQLSSLGDRYIVPFNQTNSRTYTIILHNTNNRPGGDTEADVMQQAMRVTGSEVIKIEWSDACKLNKMIESAVTGILSDCSLLIVCIMAHGYQGTLSGSGSSELPINNILHQLTKLLPPHIPLLTIIQACQDYARLSQPSGAASQPDEGSSSESEGETDPARPTQTLHVILTRPHTVLLLATVTGGVAYRGNFTGAIAQQFSLSDGKTEICEMFRRAVSNMPKVEQTPEMRTTMSKTLIVPPAIHRTDGEEVGTASSSTGEDY